MSEERDNIITLTDEDGNELSFEVLDIIEDEDKKYVVGLPEEADDDEDEGTVLIMRIVPANDDEDILEPIENEEELNRVFEIFKQKAEEDFDFVD